MRLTVCPERATLKWQRGGACQLAMWWGPDSTTRLLWHSFVLAACNLHVLLPDFKLPPLPAEKEFRDLIGSPEKVRRHG